MLTDVKPLELVLIDRMVSLTGKLIRFFLFFTFYDILVSPAAFEKKSRI